MSQVQEAATVEPPIEEKVFSRVSDSTPVLYEVPPEWKGSWVNFQAKTAGIQFLFGVDANVAVVADQVSGLSTATLTANDSTGGRVPKDATIPFICPNNATHMSIVGEAAGQWFAWRG